MHNAVKEAVLASILLSARDYIAANTWVNKLSGDDVPKQIEAGKKQFAGSEIAGKTLGVIGLVPLVRVLLTMPIVWNEGLWL
mgnify:CR=1 FL=1